jgi:hypothetical protein
VAAGNPLTPLSQPDSACTTGLQNPIAAKATMDKETPAKPSLADALLRGLRIAASTVTVVELLRNHWTNGVFAGAAWLLFSQVERVRTSADDQTEQGSR